MQENDPAIESSPATDDNPRLFTVACIFFIALLLALIFIPGYLPMIDLPQHAAQVAMWKQYAAGTLPDLDQYTLKLFTPYLGGYTFARLLSFVMPVTWAIKTTVFAALILPLAVLLWALGNRPFLRWTVFLTIPFLFNWSFYWGFLSFIFAIGPTLFCLFLSVRFIDRQSRYRYALLGICAASLFFFHIFCALMYVGLSWIYALSSTKKLKHFVFLLLSLIPFILLVAAWLHFRSAGVQTAQTTQQVAHSFWGLGFHRITNLPTTMLSGAYYGEGVAVIVLLTTLTLIAGALYFGGCKKHRLLLLLATALAYALLPQYFLNCAYIYQRFSFLLIPFAIYCIGDNLAKNPKFIKIMQACSITIPTIYLASLLGVFMAFDKEVSSFSSFTAHMKTNKRVLSMMFDNRASSVAGPVMLHFPLWYQAEHGGMVEFGFKLLLKPAPGSTRRGVNGDFVWNPRLFDRKTFDEYDYYIIKLPFELTRFPFEGCENDFELLCREGDWYLFALRTNTTDKLR